MRLTPWQVYYRICKFVRVCVGRPRTTCIGAEWQKRKGVRSRDGRVEKGARQVAVNRSQVEWSKIAEAVLCHLGTDRIDDDDEEEEDDDDDVSL